MKVTRSLPLLFVNLKTEIMDVQFIHRLNTTRILGTHHAILLFPAF